MTTPIDIRADHLRIVHDVLRRHLPDSVKVWVFGSRATWATKDSSDLDLALEGDGEIPVRSITALESAFEDSDLPYTVDVVDTRRIAARFRKIVTTQRVPLPMSSSHRNPGSSAHDDADRTAPPAATVPDPGRQTEAMTDGLENTHRETTVAAVAANDRHRSCATLPSGTTHPRGLPPAESIHWPLVPARDLFKLTYGRALAAPDRRPGNVPVYGTNGRCGTHDVALFDGPGVVLGRKGQGPLGVEWSRGPYWVIDTAYTLTPLRPDVHLKFAYYLLKFTGLNHLKDGTSNPTLSRETFGAQALPFPPVSSQRAIADILGTLDDKIELSRRMNATFEAMARALFRSWFVDFDPVRTKMEGRATGLPKHLADLFPNRLVGSELGERPEGWTVGHVEDAFDIVMGQSPPGHTYNDEGDGLPFFQGCSDFGFRYPTNRKFCTAPNRIAHPWDTIVSVRAPVGKINMAWERCSIGRGVAALRPRHGTVSYGYCAAQALQTHMREYEHTGTVFGAINRKQLARLPLQQPAPDVIRGFEDLVHPWDQTIRLRTAEVATLTALRDALLPKLVSGELRVRDAERLVGAIT